MPKIISKEKARQGRQGRHVLVILIVALVLAFVVWGLVEIYGYWIRPPGGGPTGSSEPVSTDVLIG
jgi:hypothetical protein